MRMLRGCPRGSSPQVRGKLPFPAGVIQVVRLIPAGAGKTHCSLVRFISSSAHPRRCGENLNPLGNWLQSDGSSPQVRGKHLLSTGRSAFTRLIPAGAGKTCSNSQQTRRATAHPRRCGENSLKLSGTSFALGSSPQVRGKLPFPAGVIQVVRLIPAGAGKTVKVITEDGCGAAHPRRCGEN